MKKVILGFAVFVLILGGAILSRAQLPSGAIKVIPYNQQGPCTPGMPCAATITPVFMQSMGSGSAPAPNGTPAPVSVTSFLGSTNSVQLQSGGVIVGGTNPLPVIVQTPMPWATPGGVVSQGTPGPSSCAWPIYNVEKAGTPVVGQAGSATIPGGAMQIGGTDGIHFNVPFVGPANIDGAGLGSINNTGVFASNFLYNGTGSNWDRFRSVAGRVNATDGLGVALAAHPWAVQGPVTTHASGILATFAPQVTYNKVTAFEAGIGGTGAVTYALVASADGTNWVSVGGTTGAGNSNVQITAPANLVAADYAVSVVGLGSATTISSTIEATQ
jgi:hypothetical protein